MAAETTKKAVRSGGGGGDGKVGGERRLGGERRQVRPSVTARGAQGAGVDGGGVKGGFRLRR